MIQALINFLAPLSVAETAAFALGVVGVIFISPHIIAGCIAYTVRRLREIGRTCTDREVFISEWMDAELFDSADE